MLARADIIVSSDYDADWQLVVEVKRVHRVDVETEHRLRAYLQASNCPLGLLVTLDELRVYRETYREPGIESVKLVAAHPTPQELAAQGSSEVAFERAVQGWLERLAVSGTTIVDDATLAATLDAHVVPILREGRIRAGGPRWVRATHA